ncbi:MAG: hypothetical protein IEMM0001_1151 [bacterium]|nr:MAG: hypothetical protein IEMM0001_1151 [bacterium]
MLASLMCLPMHEVNTPTNIHEEPVFLMPIWTFIIAVFLLTTANVLADDSRPEIQAEDQVRIEKPALSAKMQALLGGISTPHAALEKSREYQLNGQFGLAKIVLQHGIELAKSSGSDFVELTNELEYAMPMLQARELLVMGKPEEAEKILQGLAVQFSSDQRRSDEIAALKGALSQSRVLASARSNNERDVTRDVRSRLSKYYNQHGVFPNYTELNKLLPPDDAVLQNYEIVYFKAVPNAYRLVLRNLHNPENLLKIEATGLIK